MSTETLDKLYLEWSQFTDARTKRELDLTRQRDEFGLCLRMIANGAEHPRELAQRFLDKFGLRTNE